MDFISFCSGGGPFVQEVTNITEMNSAFSSISEVKGHGPKKKKTSWQIDGINIPTL